MRTRSPARLTLPSSTVVTCSLSPMVRRSSLLPLNEIADVRAATLRPLSGVRAFRISSATPSQNQSWSFAALMSVKGSTAIDATRSVGLTAQPAPDSPRPALCLQFDQNVVGRLDAVARALFETPFNETTHVSGYVRTPFPNRLGPIFQDGRHEPRRRITAKRPYARGQLVQHDTQREEVGAMIERLGFDLFGRHVRHRADDGLLSFVQIARGKEKFWLVKRAPLAGTHTRDSKMPPHRRRELEPPWAEDAAANRMRRRA